MLKLSTNQQAVVFSDIGKPMQVLAAAGSGKTRVLTERIRYILESTRKDGVIALTFTNKAADEMLSRLDDIEDVTDRCWIGTIHGVAQRILEQYGHTIGLPSELHIYERDQDRKALFLQSLRDNGVDIDDFLNVDDERTRKDRERIVQRYLEQFAIVKREFLTEDEIRSRYSTDESFFKTYQEYQRTLLLSGGIDFEDILVYAYRILIEQPWCGQIYRAKYRHICVDEAQDLNKAQYEFVKALCGDEIQSLMMVGDPDQMIYGFNGSSADYLCHQFPKDFSVSSFCLRENYRSSKAVIRLANKLKPGSQVESDFVLAGKSEIYPAADEADEAKWVCNGIHNLLAQRVDPEIEGDISLAHMVVIARNRFALMRIEQELAAQGIRYSLKKTERHAEPASLVGKILDLGIRVRLNPKDWLDGKKLCAALNIPLPPNWGGEGLLSDFAAIVRQKVDPYSQLQANLLVAIDQLDANEPNIPKLCDTFSNAIKQLAAGTDENEKERAGLEIQELKNCWVIFRQKGLGDSLVAFRNAIALGQVADSYDPQGLTLSTVHTMKGLEKDIVFLVGMCEGVFPDYRAVLKKDLDEEMNSAFVAVTRAKRWIFISYPRQRVMPWGSSKAQLASRFLTILSRD